MFAPLQWLKETFDPNVRTVGALLLKNPLPITYYLLPLLLARLKV